MKEDKPKEDSRKKEDGQVCFDIKIRYSKHESKEDGRWNVPHCRDVGRVLVAEMEQPSSS